MDYRTGLRGPGPGAHELKGPLSQSLCVKSLLSISYLWLHFVHLLLALNECTCAVLENVYVRQGRNYRQCSQRGCTGARREEVSHVKQALQNYNLRTYDGQSVN